MPKSILVLAVFAVASFAWGEQRTQQNGNAPDTAACSFIYSSGPSATFTRYCLSINGNVIQLDSPSGFEYIRAGSIDEGYGICDFNGGPKAYFDYGEDFSNNWGATVVSVPNATTRKFVRLTNDGIWQLTQTIKQIKATAMGPGSVKITMALKNLTGIGRTAYLLRFADVDANATTGNDEFDATLNSAFGSEPGPSFGLGLTNNTFTFEHVAFTMNFVVVPDPCNPFANANSGPFVGDGGLVQIYAFGVPAGATKTVNMTYKPI
jgi:hypothetical protein